MDDEDKRSCESLMSSYITEECDQNGCSGAVKEKTFGDLLSQYETYPLPKPQDSKYSVATVTSQSFFQEEKNLQCSESSIEQKICAVVGAGWTMRFTLPKNKEHEPIANLVIMVCETFPIKEIWIKSQKKWLTTGMAIVSDSQGARCKLMLWESHCYVLFSLRAGSLILVTNAITTHYGNELILKLTSKSILLDIGNVKTLQEQLTKKYLSSYAKIICNKLKKECALFVLKYPLLFEQHCTENCLLPKVQYCDVDNLGAGTVVHVRAKIATVCFPKESESEFKIVLRGLSNCKTIVLYLNGSTKTWKKRIVLLRKHTWEFRFLTCCTADEMDGKELHTTILSTAECLFDEDVRADPGQHLTRIKSLTELRKIMECECSTTIILRKVCTRLIKCGVRSQHFHITSETPQHLITRLIEKIRSKKVTATYIAECCFQDQFQEEYFLMDISSDNEVDVEERIKTLLMDVCVVSATSSGSGTQPEDSIPFVIFNKFIER